MYSYDVVFAAGADEILKRFLAFKAKVVISAEDFLWPDKSLLVMTYFFKILLFLSLINVTLSNKHPLLPF